MKTPDNSKPISTAPGKRNLKLTHRQHRLCKEYAKGLKLWREDVDRIAGTSNGPGVMRQLKDKGLAWQCDRIKKIDRDGNSCEPGIYPNVGNGWKTLKAWGYL